MKFALAIEKDEQTDYGVIIPDLPGCHSWGKTIDHACENAKEAILGHVDVLFEFDPSAVQTIHPKGIIRHRLNPEYAAAEWREVEVDLTRFGLPS